MDTVRNAVRETYGKLAKTAAAPGSCCGPAEATAGSGCGPGSEAMGYSAADLADLPAGADLGLGCGNPSAIAALKPGETVLDLGSGAGIDCFLAAKQVGPTGTVIGVDMTPEMVERARQNAAAAETRNVDFRLGEIEHLPVADDSVDVILSNCVINLSPDKPAVFTEAFRVLTPGGRLAVSDIVATAPLPARLAEKIELHTGCIAGAALIDDLTTMLTEAGFVGIRIEPNEASRDVISGFLPDTDLGRYVVSATIEAVKP